MNAFERMKFEVEVAEDRLASERAQFVAACLNLSDRLKDEAARAKGEPARTPDSLGIVQGYGVDIDRLCVRIALLTDECKMFRRILGSMSEVAS
jgi:hypothetical protein